jgi:hypothetical protein
MTFRWISDDPLPSVRLYESSADLPTRPLSCAYLLPGHSTAFGPRICIPMIASL